VLLVFHIATVLVLACAWTSQQTGAAAKQQLVEQQLLLQLVLLLLAMVAQVVYHHKRGETPVPTAAAAVAAALQPYTGNHCRLRMQQQQQQEEEGLLVPWHEQLLLSLGVPAAELDTVAAAVLATNHPKLIHIAVQEACQALAATMTAAAHGCTMQQLYHSSSSSSSGSSGSSSSGSSSSASSSGNSHAALIASKLQLLLVGTLLELLLLQCGSAAGSLNTVQTCSRVLSLLVKMGSTHASERLPAAAAAPAAAPSQPHGKPGVPAAAAAAAPAAAASSTAPGTHALLAAALHIEPMLRLAAQQLAPDYNRPPAAAQHHIDQDIDSMLASYTQLVWVVAAAAAGPAGKRFWQQLGCMWGTGSQCGFVDSLPTK
jgi:hypothetical protein